MITKNSVESRFKAFYRLFFTASSNTISADEFVNDDLFFLESDSPRKVKHQSIFRDILLNLRLRLSKWFLSCGASRAKNFLRPEHCDEEDIVAIEKDAPVQSETGNKEQTYTAITLQLHDASVNQNSVINSPLHVPSPSIKNTVEQQANASSRIQATAAMSWGNCTEKRVQQGSDWGWYVYMDGQAPDESMKRNPFNASLSL